MQSNYYVVYSYFFSKLNVYYVLGYGFMSMFLKIRIFINGQIGSLFLFYLIYERNYILFY